MKKREQVIAGILIALCLTSATLVYAEEIKVRLNVPTVFWASAALTASFAVEALAGVKSVDDDQDKRTLTIIFDDKKVTVDAIKEALIKADHRVEGGAEILPK